MPHLGCGCVSIVGVGEVLHPRTNELLRTSANDVTEGWVGPKDMALQVGHGHANRCVFERGAEALVRFAQLRDVVKVADDAKDVGIFQMVGDSGFKLPPSS